MSNFNATSPMVEIDFAEFGTNDDILAIKEHAFLGHVNIRGLNMCWVLICQFKRTLF